VETRRWQQLALPRDQPGGARWSLAFRQCRSRHEL
jgi:hypothetical protein